MDYVHHFMVYVQHFVAAEFNGPLFVGIGLVAWAAAYMYLIFVITPKCFSELMYHMTAVMPILFGSISLAVAVLSFTDKPRHCVQGVGFTIGFALGFFVGIRQYKNSEIKNALKLAVERGASLGYMFWGTLGGITFFTIQFFLVLGGWQLIHGSLHWGFVCVSIGSALAILGVRGRPRSKNPIRKGIGALKGEYPQ
jgi:hypothetical protein